MGIPADAYYSIIVHVTLRCYARAMGTVWHFEMNAPSPLLFSTPCISDVSIGSLPVTDISSSAYSVLVLLLFELHHEQT